MFGNLSGPTLLVILFIVLLLFGAPKLPGLAKSLGQSMRILKKEVRNNNDSEGSNSANSEDPAQPQSPAQSQQVQQPQPPAQSPMQDQPPVKLNRPTDNPASGSTGQNGSGSNNSESQN